MVGTVAMGAVCETPRRRRQGSMRWPSCGPAAWLEGPGVRFSLLQWKVQCLATFPSQYEHGNWPHLSDCFGSQGPCICASLCSLHGCSRQWARPPKLDRELIRLSSAAPCVCKILGLQKLERGQATATFTS